MSTKNSNHIDRFLNVTSSPLDGDAAGKNGLFTGTIACLTTDLQANDIIHLIPIKSSDSIKSIMLYSDDLDGGSGLTYHVGLYKVSNVAGVKTLSATGGDIDVFAASATDMRSASTAGVDHAFKTRNITAINNEAWQDVGESSDPQCEYVISITIETVAATPAAGDISYAIQIA